MTQIKKTRDENGLLTDIEYKFAEDGFINWRAMIKHEFLYPNRDFFDSRNQPVPTSVEGLEDRQLLIMLAGIKELARLRGFKSVCYNIKHVDTSYVVATCSIEWIGNYETAGETVTFEDVANATADNTDDFCIKFLETIACNRAFVRCVRNFLNIHIVGFDEIDKSKNKKASFAPTASNALPITAQGTLEKLVNEKLNITEFSEYKKHLRGLWTKASESNDEKILDLLMEAKGWNSFKDIPAKSARILIKHMSDG
jgi:hypothetical protein